MAVTGTEPVSAANLKAVVDGLKSYVDQAIADYNSAVAGTFAEVSMVADREYAGSSDYVVDFSVISKNGINVSVSNGSSTSSVTFSFPTHGVYKVTATSGFVGYMGTNGETNIRGPQEFNWDATSGQSLRIGAAGGNYRYYTEAQIKVQRIS